MCTARTIDDSGKCGCARCRELVNETIAEIQRRLSTGEPVFYVPEWLEVGQVEGVTSNTCY